MKTLSLQDGDLHIDSSGNIASASDLEALRQQIVEYLKSIRGDWALDLTHGLPYMEEVLIVGVTEGELRQVFDSAIRKFDKVTGITNSASHVDVIQRKYSYIASIYTIYGKTEVAING